MHLVNLSAEARQNNRMEQLLEDIIKEKLSKTKEDM